MEPKLKAIIARVQNLLARADDPAASVHEAALCREHAEKLMREWRIEEENLLATDQFAITPVTHRIFLGPATDMSYELMAIASLIGIHSGCMYETQYAYGEGDGNPTGYYVTYVGFEVDIRLADWILSAARVTFGNHLHPKRDETMTDQQNVYRMRRAGILRKDIAWMMWGENTPALRSKAQRLYVRECTARGETPQLEGLGTDAKAFRRAYARGFVDHLSSRLREARDAADREGGAIVLAGRAEKVREAFYEAFPHRRPSEEVAVPEKAPAKKERGLTKADKRYIERMYLSDAALAGGQQGHRAAMDVDIRRQDPTPRIEG